MHANVYTMAVLPAKEGSVDELLKELETLARETRQEHGCIEYGFYRDSSDTNTVLSYERWLDQDAEDAHWETAHLKHAIAAMDRLLSEKPQIFKTTKII